MKQTSLVAKQYRLQQWAAEIRECNSRPSDMTVSSWCDQHGITKADHYYRLRKVRQACLDSAKQDIVPVPLEAINKKEDSIDKGILDLSVGKIQIHLTSDSSMELLEKVLEVLRHVE